MTQWGDIISVEAFVFSYHSGFSGFCSPWKTIVLFYHKIKLLQKRLFNPLCILAGKRICTAKEATNCFLKAIPFWKVRNRYIFTSYVLYSSAEKDASKKIFFCHKVAVNHQFCSFTGLFLTGCVLSNIAQPSKKKLCDFLIHTNLRLSATCCVM